MGVLTGCTPRREVLERELDDAIFAADFGDLIDGVAPEVYRDPTTFFRNTHPAEPLKRVVQAVFTRLASTSEGGATIRLSTGFGGGKTHTLMALWHLGQNIGSAALGTELLPAAGRPAGVKVVAVDAGKAGVPIFGRHTDADGEIASRSLWGELLYELGGRGALTALGAADDPEASPTERDIDAAFPASGPVLILLDELVIYMAKLSARGQGNLLGFINSLAAAVGRRPQTVLVVTDPARMASYADQAAGLGAALQTAAIALDEVFGRRVSDFDPIGAESAQVIVRRLFDRVDAAAAQSTSASYHNLYVRLARDTPDLLPAHAATQEYAQRIVACYPFHPRLLDTAQDRLGALQDFQRSRGVLRLFARVLRDYWEARQDTDLISGGEINWSSPRIQADLLQRLNLDQFQAAVSADVEDHAGQLDGGRSRGVHRRVASALLLESLPMQPSSGLEPADLTLAVIRPDEAGHEATEAMDRLASICWHTYPMGPGGRGLQFRYQPNVVKQIAQRKALVPREDGRSRVFATVQQYFGGNAFRLRAWPSRANDVSPSADLQLVLGADEALTKEVCAMEDVADPAAPVPRRFQNAIIGVAPTPAALEAAIDDARALIALEEIEDDARRDDRSDAGRLVREQLQRLKPQYQRSLRLQAVRAFNRIVLANGLGGRLEEEFQVPDDQILQGNQGQAGLRRFLDQKRWIYQSTDALDRDRFVKDVLPGATPLPTRPEATTAKAVHERFLSAPGLRLLPNADVVRNTLMTAVSEGRIVVQTADGTAWDDRGKVSGPEGARRRSDGRLTGLALDASVLVTLPTTGEASRWLAVDDPEPAPGPGGPAGVPGPGLPPPPPPPPGGSQTVTTWAAAVEAARTRPLLELRLAADAPGDAGALLTVAQPFGANSLTLDATVAGTARDGGQIQFAVSGLKPNHPTRPLATAQILYSPLVPGSTYEAVLTLHFDPPGRSDLVGQLETAATSAPPAVRLRARFGEAPR